MELKLPPSKVVLFVKLRGLANATCHLIATKPTQDHAS